MLVSTHARSSVTGWFVCSSLNSASKLLAHFTSLALVQGYEFLIQLSALDHERTNTNMTSKPKYYALSAICALFKYLDSTGSGSLSPHSLKIRYVQFEGTCLIDSESAKNLELVQNVSLSLSSSLRENKMESRSRASL